MKWNTAKHRVFQILFNHMGDRSEENQLDWSGEFSLGDLLDGDVQREAIDEGPPPEGAASSIGEGNLLPGYTQVQGDEMQQNLTTATSEGAGSPPRKARMRNPKEVRQIMSVPDFCLFPAIIIGILFCPYGKPT